MGKRKRKAAFKARMKEKGYKRVKLYLPRAVAKALERLAGKGGSGAEVVARMVLEADAKRAERERERRRREKEKESNEEREAEFGNAREQEIWGSQYDAAEQEVTIYDAYGVGHPARVHKRQEIGRQEGILGAKRKLKVVLVVRQHKIVRREKKVRDHNSVRVEVKADLGEFDKYVRVVAKSTVDGGFSEWSSPSSWTCKPGTWSLGYAFIKDGVVRRVPEPTPEEFGFDPPEGLPGDEKGLRQVLQANHPDRNPDGDMDLFRKAKEKLDQVRKRAAG